MNNLRSGIGENLFKNVFDQSMQPSAVFYSKEDLFVEYVNFPMLEIWSGDSSIQGNRFEDKIPIYGQDAMIAIKKVWDTGKAYKSVDIPISRKVKHIDTILYYDFSYVPIRDDTGNVYCVLHTALDVTDKVNARELMRVSDEHVSIAENQRKAIFEKNALEESLQENELRLQGVLETMAEGVGIIDTFGKLTYANPMAQQILGLSISEIKDRTYDDPRWQNLRLDGSPLPQEEHPMSIMMRTKCPVYDVEIGVQAPGKEIRYISINAAPILNKDGDLTGGIGTFMDVTTRRMITQGKDDFISIASHELKTPVTSLKASLQILQRSNTTLSEAIREKLIAQSIRSLNSLSNLINDLLDTTRIEQGHLKLEKKPFQLNELFDYCEGHISGTTDQKITFENIENPVVIADSQQIGQVLINLITNAIKYAPDSDQILVCSSKFNSSEIKVSVIDNGPGIAQDKLDHLFKRYYRTDYNGQKFTGLGLGLYISAEIIKNHGGQIGATSQLGQGCEFWFTLPVFTG
jgi:PAS domain S-box-containing protein